MRKGGLLLVQILFPSGAQACLGSSVVRSERTVNITLGFLVVWLLFFTAYSAVRFLIALKRKNESEKKTYLRAALIYPVVAGAPVFCISEGLFRERHLFYAGYALYVLWCCGRRALRKNETPERRGGIRFVAPFFADVVRAAVTGAGIRNLSAGVFVLAGISAIAYGLRRLDNDENPKRALFRKIVWSAVSVFCIVYGARVLYEIYAYDPMQKFTNCL